MTTLGALDDSWLGESVNIPYTAVSGVLESYDVDYEDEVKLEVNGDTYYLPRDYPIYEYNFEEYTPSVLLGVVEPWSPIV